MSKPGNKGRSLDDLFKKSEFTSPDDAFEKEAREGFETLENAEEAYALKASTDARVQKEIFAPKRERTVFYWVAAASILLFVSFSIYFFKDVPVTGEPMVANDLNKKEEIPTQTIQPVITEKPAEAAPQAKYKEHSAGPNTVVKFTPEKKAEVDQEIRLSEALAANDAEVVSTVPPEMPQATSSPEPEKKKDIEVSNQSAGASNAAKESSYQARGKQKKSMQAEPAAARAPSMADERAEALVTASYPGGSAELVKSLKVKLQKRNTDVKFAAMLFINGNGSLEKVEFSPGNDLSKQQKKVIREELMTLSKFQISSAGTPATYDLRYEP